MSVSLFKSFLEEYNGCEARTMAVLNGSWEEIKPDSFLVGNYVHAWNQGTLEEFKKCIQKCILKELQQRDN